MQRLLAGALVYGVVLLLLLALLWNDRAGLTRALDHVRQARMSLLGLAFAAEALRFAALGLLLWMLAGLLGVRAHPLRAVRLIVVAVSARHLAPLGGIPDYALRARFLRQRGAPAGAIAAYFVLNGMLAWLALITVFGLGLAGYVARGHPLPTQPALIGGAALSSIAVLTLLAWLWFDHRLAGRLADWLAPVERRLPAWVFRRRWWRPGRAQRFAADLKASLAAAQAARGRSLASIAIALAAPLADIAALAAVFAALGQPVSLPAMLLGYGLAGYLAFLTPLPGDAGVVEAALALVFASLGYDLALVVAGVLLFRLLSFWLPIPLGLLVWWRYEAGQAADLNRANEHRTTDRKPTDYAVGRRPTAVKPERHFR